MRAAETLQLREGERGEVELNTALVRRFLGIQPDEFMELTALVRGKVRVAQCSSEADHVRLLQEAEQINGFNGSYMLVNGPIDPTLGARYEPNRWDHGWNGRVSDKDVQQLRAIFIDCDAIRPKGISSTPEQFQQAWDVSRRVQEFIAERLGDDSSIAHGASGNGFFILIAIVPAPPTQETTHRISKLLNLLNNKFKTDAIKIDTAVANPARLMAAPGTWKRKGRDLPDRPHRMATIICRPTVSRVPLEALC